MKAVKLILASFIMVTLLSFNAFAKEVHVWDKTPIEIKLQVNKERIIQFPTNVKLGMTPGLRNQLTLTNAAGVVYIKPNSAFSKTRVFATLDDGEVILIDFFAVDDGNAQPLEQFEIVHPETVKKKAEAFKEEKEKSEELAKAKTSSSTVTIKKLLQYAMIDLYGPNRLLPSLPIVASEIKHPLNLSHVFIKRSAGLYDLKAFKQYRTSNYTVTAIHLRNRTEYRQNIVLTDVYPAMLVDSSYETYVEPRSNDPMQRDSTTFFIVTKKPLVEYSFYSPIKVKNNAKAGKGASDE